MIVIDTSTLVAILRHEPERAALFEAISRTNRRLVTAVSYQDAGQVIFARLGKVGLSDLDSLLVAIGAEIVDMTTDLARLAVEAFTRFGKGIHSAARLNFCDCAAYALSKQRAAPLLFKGEDFVATDVADALRPAP